MVDFHSHVLPGVDDGSVSAAQSVQMLRLAETQGVHLMAATPHFYPTEDTPESFLKRRDAAASLLCQELRKEESAPALLLGAEVYYFQGMSNCAQLPDLQLGQTGMLLLEMPSTVWTDSMFREISSIHEQTGLRVVLAHVERYLPRHRQSDFWRRLDELDVLIQSNAEFFLSYWTRRTALRMLDQGKIHLLGSDCHNLNDRIPNLGEAIAIVRQKLGTAFVDRFQTHQNFLLERAWPDEME